eukprot:8408572-Alexandrium_andersonii.AAC.1
MSKSRTCACSRIRVARLATTELKERRGQVNTVIDGCTATARQHMMRTAWSANVLLGRRTLNHGLRNATFARS